MKSNDGTVRNGWTYDKQQSFWWSPKRNIVAQKEKRGWSVWRVADPARPASFKRLCANTFTLQQIQDAVTEGRISLE